MLLPVVEFHFRDPIQAEGALLVAQVAVGGHINVIVQNQDLFGRDPALRLTAFLVHVMDEETFLTGKRLLDERRQVGSSRHYQG